MVHQTCPKKQKIKKDICLHDKISKDAKNFPISKTSVKNILKVNLSHAKINLRLLKQMQ